MHLVFQGRRLNDMYRFGTKDPKWIAAALASTKPGCLFPISLIERDANKLVTTHIAGFDIKKIPFGFRRLQSIPVGQRERLIQSLERFVKAPRARGRRRAGADAVGAP